MLRSIACILAAGVLFGLGGCATTPADPEQPTPAQLVRPERSNRATLPPDRQIFINHRGMIVPIQDPHIHMERAQRAYARGRTTLAANEVEKVRGGVLWFEARAIGERRRQLEEAARALKKLERRLRRREVDSYKVLDGAFQETLDILGSSVNDPFEPPAHASPDPPGAEAHE